MSPDLFFNITGWFYAALTVGAVALAWLHRREGRRFAVPGLLFISLELSIEAVSLGLLALTFQLEPGTAGVYVMAFAARILTVLKFGVLTGVVLAVGRGSSASTVTTISGAARFIFRRGLP